MIHLLLAVIYLAFIGLGLPDAALGAAWPVMEQEFLVPVSFMGPLSMVISLGTIISSLLSAKLVSKFNTGKITTVSVAITAVALFGFGTTRSYWLMYLWAIPYGLGAGCVDACLNNYVAIHYESRHMSWLHCMWGVGASIGPYVMGYVLSTGTHWSVGYCLLAAAQAILAIILAVGIPLWRKNVTNQAEQRIEPISPRQVVALKGAKPLMLLFFCYCALEQTVGNWASSYMVQHANIQEELAASFAGMYYLGITAGRFFSGFLTIRCSDRQMILMGMGMCSIGLLLLLLPFGTAGVVVAFIMIGLGCAPIYPCVIHSIPSIFGAEKSQSVLGLVVASAYLGSLLTPTAFGFAANYLGMWIFTPAMLGIIIVMVICHRKVYAVV